MKAWLIFLLSIIVLAAFLRLFMLGSRPQGFTWDEAALGYNAYSLLKTGRDEYGKPMPVVLKSFGDYKPGLYVYFTVPTVAAMGLNEFSTRFPSALCGILLVIVVFLLAKELVGVKSGLFSAFVLAINPWAIHFSRGAWEANLSLLLITLGTTLFIKRKYCLSAVFFGASLVAYQGAKLFTPLLALVLVLIFRPSAKKIIVPFGIFVAIIAPILLGLGTQSGRLKVFSVFSYSRPDAIVQTILSEDGVSKDSWTYKIFHSELLDQSRGVAQRYLNHFSPRFLFFEGDWSDYRQTTPYYGYFHLPEILTILMGVVFLIKKFSKSSALLFLWLFMSVVPSALSRDIVTGVRALPMVIPVAIFSGIGLGIISTKKYLFPIVTLSLGIFLIYYLDLFFVHARFYSAADWLYAYKPAIEIVNKNLMDYEHVVFTNELGQPYIFILFYSKIDPKKYQQQARLSESPVGDVGMVKEFDNYTFDHVFWPGLRDRKSTIFVGGQYELPEQDLNQGNLVRLGDVNYPNGQPALRVVGLR